MAAILADEPYETLTSGFRQDFVEAPSQMLENWAWDPGILKRVSSNVTTGAPLPDDLIQKMIAARYVHYALQTTQQILYATVDMEYHTLKPPVDTTAVWASTVAATTPNQYVAGHPPAVGVRPPHGRLRRRLLRLSVVEGVRAGHVLAVQGAGAHEPGRRARVPQRHPRAGAGSRSPTRRCARSSDGR